MKNSEKFIRNLSDHTLAEVLCGDKSAFGEITERNYAALHHYGTRFTSDRDLIKDCLQDLFLEIWERRHSLSHIEAIKPYLFQSLRNNLIRRVRKQSFSRTFATTMSKTAYP